MTTVTLSKKGEIVIPKKIREAAGLQAGNQANITYTNGTIVISGAYNDILTTWENRAKQLKIDFSKINVNKLINDEEEQYSVH